MTGALTRHPTGGVAGGNAISPKTLPVVLDGMKRVGAYAVSAGAMVIAFFAFQRWQANSADQVPTLMEAVVVSSAVMIGMMVGLLRSMANLFRESRSQSRLLEESQAQLATKAWELRRARNTAVTADRAKTEFLANMSHELRTPLTGVIGLSTLIATEAYGPLNDKQREHIDLISQSGGQLLALINDLLDLSKVEAGRTELEIEQVDAGELVYDAHLLVRELAANAGVMINQRIPQPPPVLQADRRRAKQVLVNLMSNARRVSPFGSSIDIEVTASELEVSFEVWDHGPGIPAEGLERIFEPFERAG